MDRTRRHILGALCAASGLVLVPRPVNAKKVRLRLGCWHFAENSARRIGKAYLRQYHSNGDVKTLLCPTSPADPDVCALLEQSDLDTARRAIREQIQNDFTHDDLVNVDGWILARTEARICALMALL